MGTEEKGMLVEAHRLRWTTFWIWWGFAAALLLAEGLLAWTVAAGHLLLAIPAALLVAYLLHAQLLAFHEAAHGVLCPNAWLNDVVGVLIGKFHFNGLSLFRAVHHTHHAYLGTEKDEQLWPFVDPRVPRWARLLAAASELSLGILFDPVQFWRAFLRRGTTIRSPGVRRRVWAELGLTVAFWGTVLAVTAWWGAWKWLLILYLIPAILAGDMHSLRKYIEHMGLTGSTPMGLTRTVQPEGRLGRLLSFTLFHINYHGVHHYYPRMPQTSLPRFTSALPSHAPEEQTVYPSYWRALRAMLPTLRDPKVGPQWHQRQTSPALPARVALSS